MMQPDARLPDTSIHSQVNGGLDLAATSLSLGSNRSPFTENTVPMEGGGVRKRRGTRTVYREPIGRTGVSGASVTTPSGVDLIVTKETTSVGVYGKVDAGIQRLVTKLGVFTQRAATERATIVSTAEKNPRAFMLTGVNKPVQVSFHELTNYNVTSSSTVFSNAFRFNGLTTGDVIVAVDGVIQTAFSVSYAANNLTVSGITASNSTVSVIGVTWQWWAPAVQWFGSELFGTATRVGTTTSNLETLVVQVPAQLTTEIDIERNTTIQDYAIRAFNESQTAYTLVTSGSISTANQYTYSDGTVPHSGATLQPSPFFIQFGGTRTDTSTVFFTRRRRLPFTVAASDLRSNIDGSPVSTLTGATAGVYGDVVAFDANQVRAASAATVVEYVGMEQTTLGVGQLSTVQVANTNLTDTNGNQTLWRPDQGVNGDGNYVPINGLHALTDEDSRTYPRGGALFNQRLVLTGTRGQANVVLVSAVGDRRTKGINYGDFQVRDSNTDADGFDIQVSIEADEVLLAVASWQENLFLMSNKQTYRVAGQGGVFSANTFAIGTMTAVGLTNPQAYTVTDMGVFFVADSGVYSITSRDNLANEYDSVAKSHRIQPVFDNLHNNRTYDWIAYDEKSRLLYVGLEVEDMPTMARQLYVYHTQLDSWSLYSTPGNFHSWHGIEFDNKMTLFTATKWASIDAGSPTPVSFVIIQFEYDRYLDFYDTTTPDANGYIYSYAPFPAVTHTTVAGLQTYATSMEDTHQVGGFKLLPMTDLQDVEVVLDGVRQTFSPYLFSDGDYVKLPNGSIYLKSDPGAGLKLDIYQKTYLPEVE